MNFWLDGQRAFCLLVSCNKIELQGLYLFSDYSSKDTLENTHIHEDRWCTTRKTSGAGANRFVWWRLEIVFVSYFGAIGPNTNWSTSWTGRELMVTICNFRHKPIFQACLWHFLLKFKLNECCWECYKSCQLCRVLDVSVPAWPNG